MPDTRDDQLPPQDPTSLGDSTGASDPNDEIPVPIAMSAAEIDERGKVVEALRGNAPLPNRDDDESRMDA